MFVNTAAAAVCAGTALLLGLNRSNWSRAVRVGLGILVFSVGSLTLLEHITGKDFGIDTLLYHQPQVRGAVAPGRMGPPASISYTLLGLAVVFIALNNRARRVVPAFGVAVTAIATLGLTGYAYDADSLYAAARVTGIALQSAMLLMTLGIATVICVPDLEPIRTLLEDSAAGLLTRRALPFMVAVPLFLGWMHIQARRINVVDRGTGAAVLILALVVFFSGLVWWCARAVSEHERKSRAAAARLADKSRSLEVINRTGNILAGELNLEKLVQSVTDAGREISRAAFGAFFYNVKNEKGEAYTLYTISGVPREAFAKFPMPRNTALFAPTFKGEGVVRIDDVLADPRYGKNSPHHGMPEGHLPVRSYLAVPVISRSGEVLGGLFYGHPTPGIFTAEAEKIISAIASQAATAIDNAHLYRAAKAELAARRQAEEAKARLAAIVEFSEDAIYSKDLNDIVQSWNRSAERLFGYSAAEIVGKQLSWVLPPERLEEERRLTERLKSGGSIEHYETVRRRKDGTLIDVSLTISPIRDENGTVIGISKIARDITEQKRVAEALRQSERLFRELADSMPQIVWTTRADGSLDYCNKRWYEFTGFADGEISRDRFQSILHPEDRQRSIDAFADCVRNGTTFQIENRFKDRNTGGYRWFLGRAVPVRDGNGEVIRWFGTSTDIDDHKRAEEKLEKAVLERTASLRDAISQLEEFSYTVSHDLRAPLRGMRVYTDALLEDFNASLPEEAQHYLRRIAYNASRLDRMVQDVLTYSRIARTDFDLERVELDKLVRTIVDHYPGLQSPGAEIVVESLPDVLGHEPSLTQALSNLLNNAVKFVAPGVKPNVRVYAACEGGRVRIFVKDNGIGISPQYHHRLFNMFERLHADAKYEGTGVGLAIVRKAVERMGGSVGMESDGQNGCVFWIQVSAVT